MRLAIGAPERIWHVALRARYRPEELLLWRIRTWLVAAKLRCSNVTRRQVATAEFPGLGLDVDALYDERQARSHSTLSRTLSACLMSSRIQAVFDVGK